MQNYSSQGLASSQMTLEMTSATSRNFLSPFPLDRHYRSENFEGDSTFAEILMELVEEDCDDHPDGFRNCDSYHLDTRNKSEFRDQNYLFLSATEGSTTCDLQDQIASDATPASHKRRKIQNTDDTKRESFDPQRRDFLANPTVGLNEQISSSQLKLQQLSIQLQSDLPAFVSRAIQHFSDNNQCLLGEFPHAFFVEQRAFVDQAISVYFSELVPTIPSSAVGSRYDHTLNQDDRTQSTSNSLSSFPLFNGLDDPQLCRLNF